MKRVVLLAAGAVVAAGACQLFPSPDYQHLYACTTDADCNLSGQSCIAGHCGPPALRDAGDSGSDAGDAGLPDDDAGPPDAGDAGPAGFQDGGNALLIVAPVNGGALVSLASGMDDGQIYATGRSIWRQSVSSSATPTFVDHGDALAEAVEQGRQNNLGFRPVLYGEVGGDQFATVARHDVATGDDFGVYVNPAGTGGAKWRQLASFPTFRNWALVDDSNLGPLVYVQFVGDAGAALTEVDEDGGQVSLVAPQDAGWACSALVGQPDSGTLYVGLSDQVSLQTTALAIDNINGSPTIDLQLPLGVIPIPNPGGCRQIGPMAWAEFTGEGGLHRANLLFWDGTYGLATLESIDLSSSSTSSPIEGFDGGLRSRSRWRPTSVSSWPARGESLYGEALNGGRFTPGPFFNGIATQINALASSSQQILAATSTGLYEVTTLAAIDGGGVPVLADTGLTDQVPFGYAAGPHALFAFAGSDHSFPTLLQDTGLGFTPFSPPIGLDCGSQTPIDDNTTLVVCDGGAVYQVNKNGITPMGTVPGPLLAQDAPDGGIWLYTQTTPVQVGDLDAGFTVIPGTQLPVWGSPLGGDVEETYAFDNTGGLVALNGPTNTIPLGNLNFGGAGVVDPTLGTTFFGADGQGIVWACGVTFHPGAVTCVQLCVAADPIVDLQFQVIIPAGQVASLWILSRATLPAGADPAVLPPGLSHLAYLGIDDLIRAGQLDPTPACPLVSLTFPDPAAPEALLGIAAAPFPRAGAIGSFYVQGSRHLLTLSR